MSYGNRKHILGVFNLWKQSYNGILVTKHSYMGPISLVKSDSLLSPTNHSLFSFSFFFFFSTFLSFSLLLYLFLFLPFFRSKSHPKTKESQPSLSTTSLLRFACPCKPMLTYLIDNSHTNPCWPTPIHLSLSFTLPIPIHVDPSDDSIWLCHRSKRGKKGSMKWLCLCLCLSLIRLCWVCVLIKMIVWEIGLAIFLHKFFYFILFYLVVYHK